MLCLNELHEADRIATHANRIIKDKAMEVGFIGLEKMGTGMATSLLRAGYTLTVYNRTPGRDEELVRDGAKRANEIVDACRGDAVITMLADDRALESVVYGDGGMLGSLGKATLHISSSTVSVELSERLMRDHVSAGHRFIWATVFGRPDVAVAGRLSIVAAGVADAVETAMPLLEALGQKVVVVSDTPSHANLAKLSGNFLIAAAIEALGEAIALVEKAGIDKDRYLGTITTALFDLPIYRNYGDIIAARRF
jgi:3-hydroxyisobutyrate dehydrogenase-like beta-hydroxyacid dehydrogenase